MGWVVNAMPLPLYLLERTPVPIVYEGGWASGQVWKGVQNLAQIGIRSLDRPDRSNSLYRQIFLLIQIFQKMILQDLRSFRILRCIKSQKSADLIKMRWKPEITQIVRRFTTLPWVKPIQILEEKTGMEIVNAHTIMLAC
jgi:hypothetical protein